jgi:hypothetical protein
LSLAHFIDIVLVGQIKFCYGKFNVVVYAFDEDEMLRRFDEEEEEDKWLFQNEFVDNFSFKISSPPARRIGGFNLFARFCVTSAYSGSSYVCLEIRNNTSGRCLVCQAYVFSMSYARGVREIQSLMHRKLGGDDPTFDNGDDVSISVLPRGPAIQTRTIGIRWLYEEEGKDDDIQSKDEVINAHVAKVEIASHLLGKYYCAFRCFLCDGKCTWWYFAKKGLEIDLF